MTAVTLLFAHGAGFCGDVWAPIVRRLKASPLLSRNDVRAAFVTFNMPYHGTNRDVSVPAHVEFHGGSRSSPRVRHPANDWSRIGANAVLEQVQKHRAAGGGAIIGVGHSMGAASMWKAEVEHPGTFDGLVLFEPIYGQRGDEDRRVLDFMVANTLHRQAEWSSKDEALSYFQKWKGYAAWDRESVSSWVRGAVVPEDAAGDKSRVTLACEPAIEAAMYCGGKLCLSDDELQAPRCKVAFHGGERTKLVMWKDFVDLDDRFPSVYRAHPPMADRSHVLVMEDPAACADAILEDLTALPVFVEQARARL